MCAISLRSFLSFLGDPGVEIGFEFFEVAVDAEAHFGYASFVFRTFGLFNFGAADQNHFFGVWVFLGLEFVELVEPLVALFHAGLVVLSQFPFQAVLLAEVVGVEALDLQKTQLFAVVVEEPQHFWRLLFLTHYYN